MRIDSSLNGMILANMQLSQNAQNIASVAGAVGSEELMQVSESLSTQMVEQIPIVAAYEANAKGIQTQEIMMQTLLDIKA